MPKLAVRVLGDRVLTLHVPAYIDRCSCQLRMFWGEGRTRVKPWRLHGVAMLGPKKLVGTRRYPGRTAWFWQLVHSASQSRTTNQAVRKRSHGCGLTTFSPNPSVRCMSEGVRTSVLAHPAGPGARNRYEVLAEIGAGGMACVEYARLRAAHGFVRNVAIKRLHPQFAKDPEFVKMFLDEARLCARLAHANIVATLDVIDRPDGLGLVMEYVHGESLSSLLQLAQERATPVPILVATALMASVLHGLHAAHETKDDDGTPLGIVHRDVSPHNILIGADGIPRVIDFGIAKAIGKSHITPNGEIKGKLIYMAPEQLDGGDVDRRADVYGAAAVLWETLCGVSLHDAATESAIVHSVLLGRIEAPSKQRPEVTAPLDHIVLRGLQRDRSARFESARAMALALEREIGIASQSELSSWLHELAAERLEARSRMIAEWHEQGAVRAALQPLAARPAQASASERSPTVLSPAGASALRQRPRSLVAELRRFWPFGVAILVLLTAAAALWSLRHATGIEATAVVAPAPQAPSAPQVPSPTDDDAPPGDLRAAEPSAPDREWPRSAATPDPDRRVERVRVPRAPAAKHEAVRRPDMGPSKPNAESQPRTSPATAPGCKPWFYLDEAGIRRPKPGCL
jgi:eukaryotic-like serine/threonine-protein kinase